MRVLPLFAPGARVSVLCLGAHSDDIEIGAGGAILKWIASGAEVDVHWCVLSGIGARAGEAEGSAAAFLDGAAHATVEIGGFRDSYFPYEGGAIKEWFAALGKRVNPDIVLTHRQGDAHQDHRLVCELTWNTFRNHLILEYEIPKWDGDLGTPNLYVELTGAQLDRKIELLDRHFGTQRSKDWFDGETFRGLARLRGMECRAKERFAEAFVLRKAILT